MTASALILVVAQFALFAVWGFLMFKTLFMLLRRARARTGNLWPGPIVALQEIRLWLHAPADRRGRMWLAVLTALVLAGNLIAVLVFPLAP